MKRLLAKVILSTLALAFVAYSCTTVGWLLTVGILAITALIYWSALTLSGE